MAGPVRTISTLLKLDGEAEYSAQLRNINRELGLHKAELAAVEAAYHGNANSMEALAAKGGVLEKQYNAQESKLNTLRTALAEAQSAERQFSEEADRQRAIIAQNEQALSKLQLSAGDTAKEEEKLKKEIEDASKAVEDASKALADAERKQQEAANTADNYQKKVFAAEATLAKFGRAVQENSKYQDEAANSATRTAQSIDEMGRSVDVAAAQAAEFAKKQQDVANAVADHERAQRDAADSVDKTGEAVEALGAVLAAAGVAKAVSAITDALKACVDSAVEFEAAMAGVRRTVGGTDAELAAMGDEISRMSTEIPLTTAELAKIAETAGQLGIAQESVMGFTEVMAKLATATDLTSDMAATMLAQFANITGLDPADYDRLGATVANLGDATATTASKVVQMSQRMAASASIAGMSETDILAVAAAVGSLGVEAQAGGTAMSTLIQALQKAVETGDDLDKFASVAGMSAGEFSQAWGVDAVSAMDAFIQGLNDTERNGASAIVLLDELGLSNQRQKIAILGLAEAEGLLSDTLGQARQAWEDNTSLNEKASIMYETLNSKLQILDNSVDLLKTAVGDQLTPAIASFVDIGTDASLWAAEFIEQNEWVVPAMTAATAAVGAFAAGITGYIAVTKVASLITADFLAKLATVAPVVAAVGLLAGAITALVITMSNSEAAATKHAKALRENQKAAKDLQKSFEDRRAEVEANIAAINGLSETEERSAAQQQVLGEHTRSLIEMIPELAGYYNELTGELEISAQKMNELVDASLRQEEDKERMRSLADLEKDRAAAIADLEEVQERAASSGERYSHSRLEMAGGSSAAEREERRLLDTIAELDTMIEEAKGSTDGYSDSVDGLSGATNGLHRELALLEADFKLAQDAAEDALGGIISKYEEADNAAKTSAAEQQKILKSQADYWNNYSDNLEALSNRRIEGYDAELQAMIDYYNDGSKEGIAALDALNKANDEEVIKWIESMALRDEAQQRSVDTYADVSIGYSEAMADIEARGEAFTENMNQEEAMTASAVFTVAGYILGLETQEGPLQAAMDRLTNIIVKAPPKATEQASPSKLYARYAVNDILGYIQSAEAMGELLNETMVNLANEAAQSFEVDFAKAGKFDDAKKALDHARSMSIISEARYYEELLRLRDQYLQGEKNYDQYLSVSQSVFQYELKQAEEAFSAWESDRDEALKNYQKVLEETASVVEKNLREIEAEFEAVGKAQEAMAAKLGDYGNLVDSRTLNFNDGSKREITELADIEAQTRKLEEYGAMLQSLSDRGLNSELMSKVGSMGVDEAMQYGKLMLDQSESDFDAYNTAWEEKQRVAAEISERFYKDELEAVERKYGETLQEGIALMEETANAGGEDVIRQLIDGMENMEPELQQKLQEINGIIEQNLATQLNDAILASMPTTMEAPVPRQADSGEIAGQVLTMIAPMLTAATAQPVPANISFQMDGVEFFRAQLPNIRQAEAESPIIIKDF